MLLVVSSEVLRADGISYLVCWCNEMEAYLRIPKTRRNRKVIISLAQLILVFGFYSKLISNFGTEFVILRRR